MKQVSDHYLPKLLPHEHGEEEENDMKARNIVNNFDGLGVVWYTSSHADFECRNTSESSDWMQKQVRYPDFNTSLSLLLNIEGVYDQPCTKRFNPRETTRTSFPYVPIRRPLCVLVIFEHRQGRRSPISTIIPLCLADTHSCTMALLVTFSPSSEMWSTR